MGALGSGATRWGLGAVATDRVAAMSSRPRMSLQGRNRPHATGPVSTDILVLIGSPFPLSMIGVPVTYISSLSLWLPRAMGL
jgi:hypothetical protein